MLPRRTINTAVLTACILMVLDCMHPADSAVQASEKLSEGFRNPPNEAKLRVWWWCGNGPKGKESLKADLEAMNDNEIAGVTFIDATFAGWGLATSDVYGAPFMGPKWREQFKYAVTEADRLGIEVSVNLASGWNAGGPWMTVEHSPKRLTFTSTELSGPQTCDVGLPIEEGHSKNWHRDIRVLAVPVGADGNISTIEQLRAKAFYVVGEEYIIPTKVDDRPDDNPVKKETVLDITKYMDAHGQLKWDVPPGKWLILRIGYAFNGDMTKFHSWTSSGKRLRGYECDPLSKKAAEIHFENMAAVLAKDAGDLAGKTLNYFHVDSWERIVCNWTEGFAEEFQRRRGYSIWPYLPVLAGIVVDSRSISNRFLHDFRLTVSDMIVDNYYGHFKELSHRLGMKFHAESTASSLAMCIWDQMKAGKAVDIPMGEAWVQDLNEPQRKISNWYRTKPAASAAHIYGSQFAANEQFTSSRHWLEGPYDLKPIADRAFYNGCNRFFWHTYSHSSIDVGEPGHVYFAGTHFNRNITWWDDAVAFSRYIARCQYLLSRGRFVADICYYYGDEIPNALYYFNKDDFCKWNLGGFDYDVTGADAIMERMTVKDGRITLPDGMSYKLLVLAERQTMSLELLQKLQSLVKHGAVILGSPPREVSGLTAYPRSDKKLKEIVDRLWGPCNGKTITENKCGKGRVIWRQDSSNRAVVPGEYKTNIGIKRVVFNDLALRTLAKNGISPDFSFKTRHPDSEIRFIHRRTEDAEIYFVHNTQARPEHVDCSFRVTGKEPQLWDPATGGIVTPALYDQKQNVTSLPLQLDPYGSVFVVFRRPMPKSRIVSISKAGATDHPNIQVYRKNDRVITLESEQPGDYELLTAAGKLLEVRIPDIAEPLDIDGSWQLSFPSGWAAPDNIRFMCLIPWNICKDDGMKYFSGTVVYMKDIEIPDELVNGPALYLDLGSVEKIAHVWVNGKDMGILWKEPFRIEISKAAKPGINSLEILVTNTWANRLIGDSRLPEAERFTQTNVLHLSQKVRLGPDAELLESGLLGPVRIVPVHRMDIRLE